MARVSEVARFLVAALAISLYILQEAGAVKFDIKNQCGYTVWAAGLPGGGQRLDQGQTWTVNLAAGTQSARFWGRTGCTFDASGAGSCQTGDCGGKLSCTLSGAVPATLAEYTQSDQDYYDVSLVDGFNIPVAINPSNAQCTAPACKADINAVCPSELKVDGGCNSACNVFQTDQYCCRNAYVDNCPATNYSMIFKQQCPQAYSYAKDDTATFACASGGDMRREDLVREELRRRELHRELLGREEFQREEMRRKEIMKEEMMWLMKEHMRELLRNEKEARVDHHNPQPQLSPYMPDHDHVLSKWDLCRYGGGRDFSAPLTSYPGLYSFPSDFQKKHLHV